MFVTMAATVAMTMTVTMAATVAVTAARAGRQQATHGRGARAQPKETLGTSRASGRVMSSSRAASNENMLATRLLGNISRRLL